MWSTEEAFLPLDCANFFDGVFAKIVRPWSKDVLEFLVVNSHIVEFLSNILRIFDSK